MGNPDASQEINIASGLHQMHLGHDTAHLTGQRGKDLNGTGDRERGDRLEMDN